MVTVEKELRWSTEDTVLGQLKLDTQYMAVQLSSSNPLPDY